MCHQDAAFRLQRVDVQLGCQSLLRHGHALFSRQMKEVLDQQDRAAREAKDKPTAKQQAHAQLRRQKLVQLQAQFEDNYRQAGAALTTVARNLDFAEVNLALGLHAGPAGLLSMSVSDIAAKLPVLLSARIARGKTMGNLPLVPYMMSMQVTTNLAYNNFSRFLFFLPEPHTIFLRYFVDSFVLFSIFRLIFFTSYIK